MLEILNICTKEESVVILGMFAKIVQRFILVEPVPLNLISWLLSLCAIAISTIYLFSVCICSNYILFCAQIYNFTQYLEALACEV